MPNRLASETSPYLQQHADNPVDWYPWGAEALERARREDKAILLSVGYSACHWCHVMAHESFEDAEVAALMNRLFVSVKVDREERPDIDQIYQAAHQLLSQRGGGWPLTMFLAPDGTPFFGGTYFPKTPRHGLPGFPDLLERVAEVWKDKRSEIREQGEQIAHALASTLPRKAGHHSDFSAQPVREAIGQLRASFDPGHGGFGRAPKFPHPTDLELCLRVATGSGDTAALEMVTTTLDRMIAGGIFDQLGGGFCRYSVDQFWMIPHFEKMLYDNGALLALLAQAAQATGHERYRRAAAETAAWATREMQSPEGGFYSSLDADSEHEEGKFYVWDREEVRALLSAEEYAAAAPSWGLDSGPNFEGLHWHLHVAQPGAAPLLIDCARRKLFEAREKRVRPGRDDKVLVSWNALMIRGMALFARASGSDVRAARRALDFIRTTMWRNDRLLATYKDGRAHLNAYLDDYAFLIDAIIELLQADFDARDLAFACELAEVLLEEFEDRQHGGFFFTGRSHERLIHRDKPGHDNATPSGNGVAALALNRLAALTGEERYAQAARRTLELFYPALQRQPVGFAVFLQALQEQLEPPAVLVLRGAPQALAEWTRSPGLGYLPGVLQVAVAEGTRELPPVLDKPAGPRGVNAWLCRGVTCLPPMTGLDEVRAACRTPMFG
ncbi:MAG: thioredoxin domain-containing protein [Betaproteobacteria bacterium]|nr:thioredoxin domain-containing protein [Betaproteobacteria bacterium]